MTKTKEPTLAAVKKPRKKVLPPAFEDVPITSNELYAVSLVLDEVRIALDQFEVRLENSEKAQVINSTSHEAIMKIMTEKGIVTRDELKQVYTNFKNADYGVVH